MTINAWFVLFGMLVGCTGFTSKLIENSSRANYDKAIAACGNMKLLDYDSVVAACLDGDSIEYRYLDEHNGPHGEAE